jgi:hypothetical protein
LTTTDHTLQNTQVVSNGTAGGSGSTTGGINATASASVRAIMVNNTIVGNSNTTGIPTPSGVECPSGTTFFNNVVFGNAGATSEIDTVHCAPDHSAFSVTASGTNFNTTTCTAVAQLFNVSAAGLYVPRNPVTAPCTLPGTASTPTTLVGIGTPMFSTATAPTYDLTGAMRPNPPAIGALE